MKIEKRRNKDFRELNVWLEARILKNQIFQLVKSFPPEEKYRLSDQVIRSSRSINDNIAEGHGRFSYKDQLHFCIQARGSLSETLNHLINALDCAYIDQAVFNEHYIQYKKVEQLLNGYITFLRNKI